MKLSQGFDQIKGLIEEKYLFPNQLEISLNKAAETLREELINQITQSSLSEQKAEEIIRSIVIEKISPTKLNLKIAYQDIKTIEYGTQQQDEDPIILRAKKRAEPKINQIIQTSLNNIKKP